MQNADGGACELEPRVVLQRVLKRLHERNCFPVVAAELESTCRIRSPPRRKPAQRRASRWMRPSATMRC